MKPGAAIFDMDGTLVDSLMLWDVIWADFGEVFLHDPTFHPNAADDRLVRTLTLKDAMILIHERYHIGDSGQALLDEANRLIIDFYANEVQLKPGVREWLEHCAQNGIPMCVASATARDLIETALAHCDIAHYFKAIFSCDELGKGKDQPDIYLLARECLGAPIEETCVFEDSLTAIETATKLGMQTVGIFDRFNFGQEEIRRIATRYIAEGEALSDLIDEE